MKMIFQRTTEFLRQASRMNGSRRPFHTVSNLSPALIGEKQTEMSLLGNIGYAKMHSGSGSVNFIKELLEDKNPSRNLGRRFDYGPSSFQENRNFGRSFNQPNLETNADIVHIKLMRNNAFVTVTDSKGNKKAGISTGKLAGKGTKITRYSAEAAAENMGREVRKMKTKSVVVKVNGFTYFRKKKEAILSFKDGYTNSRPEGNPIVFIEDTTRKPHNGCRLKKKRRI